jgi:hypothetical protein
MSADIYDRYSEYVRTICSKNNLTEFKSNPLYTYMLEHVSLQQGYVYLECIFQKTTLSRDEVVKFCSINDATGKPRKGVFPEFLGDVSVSPSSIRYIYQAHMILSHMKKLGSDTPRDIVEIGGGYGGLCLAIHYFAPRYDVIINTYTICDLTDIIRLQEMYLTQVNPDIRVDYVDATTYGANIPHNKMFLISNYCLSEISNDHQKKYRQYLFPKVEHGFFVWNCIPLHTLGLGHLYNEPEVPNTGNKFNRYVWF